MVVGTLVATTRQSLTEISHSFGTYRHIVGNVRFIAGKLEALSVATGALLPLGTGDVSAPGPELLQSLDTLEAETANAGQRFYDPSLAAMVQESGALARRFRTLLAERSQAATDLETRIAALEAQGATVAQALDGLVESTLAAGSPSQLRDAVALQAAFVRHRHGLLDARRGR
jgi:hypothetical protein